MKEQPHGNAPASPLRCLNPNPTSYCETRAKVGTRVEFTTYRSSPMAA
jgi:hypothetical protein